MGNQVSLSKRQERYDPKSIDINEHLEPGQARHDDLLFVGKRSYHHGVSEDFHIFISHPAWTLGISILIRPSETESRFGITAWTR